MAHIQHAALTRNLQCPICLSTFADPKQLSCTHTFCTSCLNSLLSLGTGPNSISCPICRSTTRVKSGDISTLPSNASQKGTASGVKDQGQQCGVCHKGSNASRYCCDCEQILCNNCRVVHVKRKRNANHKIVSAADVLDGKVILKRKVYCKEHNPSEGKQECTDVCITCKKFICTSCRMLEHGKKGHVVKSAADYQDYFSTVARTFQENAEAKAATLRKDIGFVASKRRHVIGHIDVLSEGITRDHDEAVRKLNREKETLLGQCKAEKDRLCRELGIITQNSNQMLMKIESSCDLVKKSGTASLEGNTVAIRESLCDEMKTVLTEVKPSESCSAEEIATRAESLEYKCDLQLGRTPLGTVEYTHKYSTWKLQADIALSTVDNMNCMVATPDGKMAVGCNDGEYGIEIYSADGQLQKTVLDGKDVHAMGFLSDGRCVVRDVCKNNTITVYAPGWETLDVEFETLGFDDGGNGGLTVDSNDRIYVSYRDVEKIQVFTPAGGKPIREIPCGGYEPDPLFAMRSNQMLVVSDFSNSARVIDNKSGCKRYCFINDADVSIYPALRADDSILLAAVNGNCDRVTIDHYTCELKHVSTLIADHVIEKTEREWYCLQEFSSGEIAFSTPCRVYIFSK